MAFVLPEHTRRRYDDVGVCIYCGTTDQLTDEHIISLAMGGRWVLPKSSCKSCAVITGKFEGELARTILGPLRMLYDMPTRRRKERPKHLELKVKYATSEDWEIAHVDRSICPFLVGMPLYPMPDALTGQVSEEHRSAATQNIWIRGGGFRDDKDAHMEWLCQMLGAVAIMPTAHIATEAVCLTVAKVAHAYAVGELGIGGFKSFLTGIIRDRDLSDRASYIGGGEGNEPPSNNIHEVAFERGNGVDTNIVAVRVRLLGVLGMPTYHVAVGYLLS